MTEPILRKGDIIVVGANPEFAPTGRGTVRADVYPSDDNDATVYYDSDEHGDSWLGSTLYISKVEHEEDN